MKNFKPKALKIDESGAVLIQDEISKLNFWVDIWPNSEGELQCDWNQYIFDTSNSEDILRNKIQSEATIAEECFSLALEFYENNLK